MGFIPSINHPPALSTFHYPLPPASEPTSTETEAMKSQLRGRINPLYESGKMTPAQKKRAAAITLLTVSTVLAVGAILAGALTGLWPICFAAIPLGLIAIGASIYLGTQKKDLDSPSARSKVMQKLALKNLAQIADRYRLDKIIGYGLLDRIAPQDPDQRARFYHRFQHLYNQRHDAFNWATEGRQNIDNIFHRETDPLTRWKRDRETIIHQGKAIRDMNEAHIHHMADRAHMHHHHRRGHRLDAIGTGVHIANTAADISDYYTLESLNQAYGAHMGPWWHWQREQKNAINSARDQALYHIETMYEDAKRG